MTLKVTERVNGSALAQLEALAQSVTLKMAQIGAEQLRDNLGDTSGGRGVKYPTLPNRSSAPGQYPIKQSGRLQNMVGWGVLKPGVVYFGLEPKNADEREQALNLELGAPSQNLIARAPVRRTATAAETHNRMRQAKP